MKTARNVTFVALLTSIMLISSLFTQKKAAATLHAGRRQLSFIDALPGKPGLAIANYFNFYDGSASASKQLPSGDLLRRSRCDSLFRHDRGTVSNAAGIAGAAITP